MYVILDDILSVAKTRSPTVNNTQVNNDMVHLSISTAYKDYKAPSEGGKGPASIPYL